jgi:hypothetical protein
MVNIASRAGAGWREGIDQVRGACRLRAFRDGVRIAAVAPLVVSVYYLCHHVAPRRHTPVISLRDASADETLNME